MNIEDLQTALADFEGILTFEDNGEWLKVQTTGFLEKNKWGAVNEQIRKLGGQWVGGLGKNSHWKISKEDIPEDPWQDVVVDLEGAMDAIRRALNAIEKAKT